jgi:hypothetical protein
MLRISIGQDDRWEGKPLYEQIVLKLREQHAAGATVHKGTMGYGATQRMHQTNRLGLSRDLPVMITVVESEERVRALLPVLDSMVRTSAIRDSRHRRCIAIMRVRRVRKSMSSRSC